MPLEWIIFQIFINTVEITVLFYLLCNKFAAKHKIRVPTLLSIVGTIILLSLPMFMSFGNVPFSEIVLLSISLIYLVFFRDGNILKKIFWVLISFAIIASINFLSITLITIVSKTNSINIVTQQSTERLFVLIIAKILQMVIFYILSKRHGNSEVKSFLSPVPMMVSLIIPLISAILITFIFTLVVKGFNIPEEVIFYVSIGYLAINIIVFVLYEFINREAEKNYVLIAKHKQYELTEQHNNQIMDIYDKMREWRHNYTNHMQLVVGMLEKVGSNSNSEAINYIKDLDEKIKSTSLEIVTGNLVVDAIISAKATLASVHNIKFEYNIFLKDDIPIESTDLCSILSNLLDNAIEACRKLNENRYISLEMLIFKNQFNIKITNATNGEYKLENGKLKTTKSGDLHGIGMGYVKSVVESYLGIFDIKPESESFTTHISVPLARKSVN